MKQEEATYEKLKKNDHVKRHGVKKDSRAPYVRTRAVEIPRYINMRQFWQNCFPDANRGGIAMRGANRNEVTTIREHKKNGGRAS